MEGQSYTSVPSGSDRDVEFRDGPRASCHLLNSPSFLWCLSPLTANCPIKKHEDFVGDTQSIVMLVEEIKVEDFSNKTASCFSCLVFKKQLMLHVYKVTFKRC